LEQSVLRFCRIHAAKEIAMLDRTALKFSHVKPGDTEFKGEGLRDFFLYRDLGVADATAGKVLAQLVTANLAPEKGTGWHYHGADFHIVLMLKGWARFMYEDKETLVEAGDCVHQRPARSMRRCGHTGRMRRRSPLSTGRGSPGGDTGSIRKPMEVGSGMEPSLRLMCGDEGTALGRFAKVADRPEAKRYSEF
jgi:quercetin dioxygenase-like cupin family protein